MSKTQELKDEVVLKEFKDYVEWTSTVSIHKTYEQGVICSLLGMLGEYSEYMQKWDQAADFTEEDTVELRKELGDITWYVAHFIYRTGIVDELKFVPIYLDLQVSGLQVIGDIQEGFKKVVRDSNFNIDESPKKSTIIESVNRLVTLLCYEAEDNGWDFLEILADNMEKLGSRKERGVISGSGDNR